MVHTTVDNWLKAHTAAFYEENMENLVPRYDKRLIQSGVYEENYLEAAAIHIANNIFLISTIVLSTLSIRRENKTVLIICTPLLAGP